VPPQTINILNRFVDPQESVKIFYEVDDNKRRLFFSSDSYVVSTAELTGDYPYEAIIKMMSVDLNHSFSVNTPDLIDALKACKAIAGGAKDLKARTITIDSDASARIANIKTAEANEIGVMELQVGIHDAIGEDIVFNINADFVDRVIGVIEKARKQDTILEDKITISMSDETAFVYFAANGVDALFTIAPVAPPTVKN
jgi:hypothetical protein